MTGKITLSLEVELGWGYHDLDEFDAGRHSANRSKETRILRRLLERGDELDVPFTFDVVGHLFHELGASYESPHPDGWFESLPRRGDDSLFYASDMITDIHGTNADHEICTHTYSHVPCATVPKSVVDWELERAQEVHRAIDGTPSVSMVPPRHSEPPKDVLKEHGIEIVRVLGYDSAPTMAHKFGDLFFDPPEPKEPELRDGVVETYCTQYATLPASSLPKGQRSPMSVFRAMPTGLRQRLHERYLVRAVEKAVEQDSYLHLWGHLHELANDDQWRPIRSFMETLAEYRDRGDVEILTMERLNERIRKREGDESDVRGTASPDTEPEYEDELAEV